MFFHYTVLQFTLVSLMDDITFFIPEGDKEKKVSFCNKSKWVLSGWGTAFIFFLFFLLIVGGINQGLS